MTAPAEGSASSRTVTLITPDAPGLYRLVTTLHDKDGVAFDAASQAQVPALLVRVTGGLWASYGLPADTTAAVGEDVVLQVRVANSGSLPWTAAPGTDPAAPGTDPAVPGRIRPPRGPAPRREAAPRRGARAWWATGSRSREPASPVGSRPTPRSPPTSSLGAAPCWVCTLPPRRSPGRTCSSWTSPCPMVDRSPVAGVPPGLVRVTVGTTPSSAGDPGARAAPAP